MDFILTVTDTDTGNRVKSEESHRLMVASLWMDIALETWAGAVG